MVKVTLIAGVTERLGTTCAGHTTKSSPPIQSSSLSCHKSKPCLIIIIIFIIIYNHYCNYHFYRFKIKVYLQYKWVAWNLYLIMLIMALMKKVIHRMKNVKLPDGPSAHCSQLCFVPHPPSPPCGVHVLAFHKQPVSYGVMSSRWRLWSAVVYGVITSRCLIWSKRSILFVCFATEEAEWKITNSEKKLKCRLNVYDMEEFETLSSCVRSGW